MNRILGCLVISILLSVAVSGQKPGETAIRKVMDDQVAAWNRGDIDAFMTGYWRSEKLRFVSGGKVTHGWQQTLDNYKRSYDTREKMGVLSFGDLEFDILSKDAAFVIGTWDVAATTGNQQGKFSLLFRKFKDGWRIVLDHTS